MTIRHLKIFLSLIDNSSNMTKTAEVLNITQPALSIAIREMEQYYGVLLFDRIGRHLVLSEAGRRYAERARHIVSLFDEMERSMRNWEEDGTIRVGSSITIGTRFLPSYIRSFSSRHPGLDIRVIVDQSSRLERCLLNDTIDIALTEGLLTSSELIAAEYMDDSLVALCSPSGPFKNGERVSVKDFSRCRFLLREKGSGTRDEFDAAALRAGFKASPSWESISTTALVEATIAGLGITVLPYRLVEDAIKRKLVSVFHVEGLDLTRRFRLVYHKDKFLHPGLKEFISLVMDFSHSDGEISFHGLF